MPLLSIKHATRRFAGLTALDDVGFDVEEGQVVGLIGPNGAGKTTMINLITGVTPPSSGEIILRGQPITGLRTHQIARRGVARTFQHIRLFDGMTVIENVMIGLDLSLRSGYFASIAALPGVAREEAAAREQALEIIERVAPTLARRADDMAAALSYADKRRVEIARALAMRPVLLLLDEPAAGMAPQEMRSLAEDLQRLNTDGMAVILIEHKMRLIEGVTDKVVVLDHGRKIFEGPFDVVKRDPAVIEAYLGRSQEDAHVAPG